jgi:thiamine-monophosphate kinase
MKISDTGEFGLIDIINDLISRNTKTAPGSAKELLIGIGDDTAAWKCRGRIQLSTTDILVQDVHFDLAYTGWDELGHKSIAINLSDIAAMGGIPQYALVSLSLPGDTEVEDIKSLYSGMLELCNRYNVTIAGGNIASADKIIVNITLYGYTDNTVLTRSSAHPGDKIAITGFTGLSKAGMIALQRNMKMEPAAMEILRRSHNSPEPRIEFGKVLAECGVKAAIDVSDGLIADLKHICDASKASALINMEKMPVHDLLRQYFKDDAISLALTGGEDYELLFTGGDRIMDKVKGRLPEDIHVIGSIESGLPGDIKIIDEKGDRMNIKDSGWDHFR